MKILRFTAGSGNFNPCYYLEDEKRNEFSVVIGTDYALTGDGRAPTMGVYLYDKSYVNRKTYPVPAHECPSRNPDDYIKYIGDVLIKVDSLDELLDILKLEKVL